jgi:hypothetical protein
MPLSTFVDGKASRNRDKSEDLPLSLLMKLSGKRLKINSLDLFKVFSLEIIPLRVIE